MPKPVTGGSIWDREGIEPAQAFWVETEAYRKAIIERIIDVPDRELVIELLQLINSQGDSLLGLRDALHTLEVIGIEAKRDRLDNGETPRSTKKR